MILQHKLLRKIKCKKQMQKKRKIAMVVNKFSSHQAAEEADEMHWRNSTAEQRLEEWSRLLEMYCKLHNITGSIKKIYTKTKQNAF